MRAAPIHTEGDHARTLKRIEQLMSARPDTAEGAELEVLSILVESYEREHHPIEAPDPVAAIQFRLEQGEVKRSQLEAILGSRSRVSEILNHKRGLTVAMIRRLHSELGIPLEPLVGVTVP